MDTDSLPPEFDVIVIGTGLPESILAAACQRSGLSVLHLDSNDFYGGVWTSFNLHSAEDWLKQVKNFVGSTTSSINVKSVLQDGETFIPLVRKNEILNADIMWNISDDILKDTNEDTRHSATINSSSHIDCENKDENCEHIVKEKENADCQQISLKCDVQHNWRRFSLDLLPKVLLSRGLLVETLCDSEASKYCEFKCVDRLLCLDENIGKIDDFFCKYYIVPCSRAEVFRDENISMMDKRRVMKFLSSCVEWKQKTDQLNEILACNAGKSFEDFLLSQGISGSLKNFVCDGIGILRKDSSVEEGLESISRFLESVGRFGNSPFLWTLYGSGELPQCFCRLCAVYGGIYCLKCSIDAIILNENRVVAVLVNGQRISCRHVVFGPSYIPNEYLMQDNRCSSLLHRGILIADVSLMVDPEKEHISLVNLERICPTAPVHLLEVGFEGCVAPKNYYVCHLTSYGEGCAQNALNPIIEKLFRTSNSNPEDDRPFLIWSLLLDIAQYSTVNEEALPTNICVVPSADSSLDYSDIVSTTKRLFTRFWPDRDFLPKSICSEEEPEENEELPYDHQADSVTNDCYNMDKFDTANAEN